MTRSSRNEPQLQEPGEGLPFLEGIYLRYIYGPRERKHHTWQESLARLKAESGRLVAMATPLTDEAFFKRALIDRMPGLEDSSRHWSVAMTIEHLIITLRGMTQVAETLAQGKPLNVTISTATVKPQGGTAVTKADWVRFFTLAVDEAYTRLSRLEGKVDGTHRVAHPFFGALNADGWVWVMAEHQALHCRQAGVILLQTGVLNA